MSDTQSDPSKESSENPEPMPVPHMDSLDEFDPAFSPSMVIDLNTAFDSIHESKGTKAEQTPIDASDLLNAIVEEANILRQSKTHPEKLIPVLMDKVGYGLDSVMGLAALRISEVAGGIADQPTYHNPQHITEVIVAAFCLGKREHLSDERLAEVMIAAAGHDLGHDGSVNKTPYSLETRSYEIAYPILETCEVPADAIERIGQMILATDFANGVPIVRQNYLHFKDQGNQADQEAKLLNAQCLILTEADILFSCFNESYNETLSNLLSEEWNKGPALDINARIGFLKSVQFTSDASLQLGLEQRRQELIESLEQKAQ
ncbi:MAG: hypothetical protein AAFY98_09760 [Verrucomicrobiota bacterium]